MQSRTDFLSATVEVRWRFRARRATELRAKRKIASGFREVFHS